MGWVFLNVVPGELRTNQPLSTPVLPWLCPTALSKRGKENVGNSTHAAA